MRAVPLLRLLSRVHLRHVAACARAAAYAGHLRRSRAERLRAPRIAASLGQAGSIRVLRSRSGTLDHQRPCPRRLGALSAPLKLISQIVGALLAFAHGCCYKKSLHILSATSAISAFIADLSILYDRQSSPVIAACVIAAVWLVIELLLPLEPNMLPCDGVPAPPDRGSTIFGILSTNCLAPLFWSMRRVSAPTVIAELPESLAPATLLLNYDNDRLATNRSYWWSVLVHGRREILITVVVKSILALSVLARGALEATTLLTIKVRSCSA